MPLEVAVRGPLPGPALDGGFVDGVAVEGQERAERDPVSVPVGCHVVILSACSASTTIALAARCRERPPLIGPLPTAAQSPDDSRPGTSPRPETRDVLVLLSHAPEPWADGCTVQRPQQRAGPQSMGRAAVAGRSPPPERRHRGPRLPSPRPELPAAGAPATACRGVRPWAGGSARSGGRRRRTSSRRPWPRSRRTSIPRQKPMLGLRKPRSWRRRRTVRSRGAVRSARARGGGTLPW